MVRYNALRGLDDAELLALYGSVDTLQGADLSRIEQVLEIDPADNLTDAELEDRERCEASLHYFMRRAWQIIEPGREFFDGPHLHAICEHLEACSRGEIRKIVINVPPRTTKSTTCSVCWHPWEWTFSPSARFLTASYGAGLATRDAVKSRRIIESKWYQRLWGNRVVLTSDQNVKTRYENSATGFRIATSVNGGGTGEGGDRILVDDAHNVRERNSKAALEAANDWWFSTMSTRANNQDTAVWAIIGQRVAENDITSRALESGEYAHLLIPMEYDPKLYVKFPLAETTAIGWSDWRTEPGELLAPERFNKKQVESLRRALHIEADGQLQQNPSPSAAELFDRSRLVPIQPELVPWQDLELCRGWDKAGTQGAGDYTVGVLLGRSVKTGRFYILDVFRKQLSYDKRDAAMVAVSKSDEMLCEARGAQGYRVKLEQEPGSEGKKGAQLTILMLSSHEVRAEPATGDKVTRARKFLAVAGAGGVSYVVADWNADYFREMESVPNSAHDDQWDGTSIAYNELALDEWGGEPIPDEILSSADPEQVAPLSPDEVESMDDWLRDLYDSAGGGFEGGSDGGDDYGGELDEFF